MPNTARTPTTITISPIGAEPSSSRLKFLFILGLFSFRTISRRSLPIRAFKPSASRIRNAPIPSMPSTAAVGDGISISRADYCLVRSASSGIRTQPNGLEDRYAASDTYDAFSLRGDGQKSDGRTIVDKEVPTGERPDGYLTHPVHFFDFLMVVFFADPVVAFSSSSRTSALPE